MMGRDFILSHFSTAFPPPQVRITGSVDRRGSILAVRYDLHGPTETIAVPAHAAVPARRDGLWQETCFELFLGPEGADRYWEFNFSPSGNWNAYGFEAYRQGMREELAFSALHVSVEVSPDALSLSGEIDLERIIPGDRAAKAGISAVIRSADGHRTYWALTHPGTKPDFHRRDCFIIDC